MKNSLNRQTHKLFNPAILNFTVVILAQFNALLPSLIASKVYRLFSSSGFHVIFHLVCASQFL